jgi:hypothetical protein
VWAYDEVRNKNSIFLEKTPYHAAFPHLPEKGKSNGRAKICEDKLGHGAVDGVGDVKVTAREFPPENPRTEYSIFHSTAGVFPFFE